MSLVNPKIGQIVTLDSIIPMYKNCLGERAIVMEVKDESFVRVKWFSKKASECFKENGLLPATWYSVDCFSIIKVLFETKVCNNS